MDHSTLQYLWESARDMVAYEAWYALGGLVLTGLGLLVAYLKGAGKPVLWFLAGAVTSIATLLIVWLILIWSGPKTMAAIAAALVFGALLREGVRVYQSEKARLRGHPKGLMDFNRDFKIATKQNLQAMARLTKENQTIGEKTSALAGQLQTATTDAAKEAVLNRAARLYRRTAARYMRLALSHQEANLRLTTAAAGIFGWLQQTGNTAQLQQQLTSVNGFRTAVVTARASVQGYRNAVGNLPNMSQRMNAAKADLLVAIDISLNTFDSAIAFADNAIGLLPSSSQC